MPNLVGIGLSQVPTNSMLGGLAYQDPEHASIKDLDLKNLSQINSEISDTAVDVFVYDTRKDSDGGAWRKRTQHTSWYKETLGTTTRGTRREFPSVAIIVIERQKIRIYDGDDPDLSMWMVFEINQYTNGGNLSYTPFGIGHVASVPHNSVSLSSVHMLNGLLFIGGNRDTNAASVHAAYDINFISEVMHEYLHYPTSATRASKWKLYGNISQRNSTDVVQYPLSRYRASGTDGGFSHVVNDVTMTVLPNAPIDDATGLPVPTIAVGTGVAGAANGGVSVIKDDGSVVDIIAGTGAGGYASYNVEFGSNNELIHTQAYNNSYASVNIFDDIPSSDVSASNSYSAARSYLYVNGVPDIRGGKNGVSTPNLEYVSKSSNGDIAFGFQNTDAKLSLLSEPKGVGTVNQKSAVAYIGSDYNTGWMIGDTEGAFLSDTDTTNLVGTNLVSNGTFDTDTSGWSTSGSITVTQDAGRLKMVSNSGNPLVYQAVTCVVGKRYYVQLDVQGEVSFHAGPNASSAGDVAFIPYSSHGSLTTKYCFFVATATTMYLVPHVIGTGNTGYIDNVICKLADHDRTRNGAVKANVGGSNGRSSGLAVYGTITKQPVATGAELVAYSGFTASNYLSQPFNSDMNHGTGDFCYAMWVNIDSTGSDSQTFVDKSSSTGGTNNPRIRIHKHTNGTVRFYTNGGNVVTTSNFENLGWTQLICLRRSTTIEVWVNGNLENSGSSSTDFNSTAGQLNVGVDGDTTDPLTAGSITLVRVSNSAPSAEQVKKMYNDEKHLFQENAKATLYGSSNAVTGLAHDDSTDTLHVGTSAGRSEFQGLCRINNTTEAVTTAISASNGLVAEQ